MNRPFRYAMFAALYFVQGVGLAYFRTFQKPYLARFGIDADEIGLLTALLLLPFILKIFIGMLSDRVNLFGMGHRKPYMVGGLLLAALGFGAGALVQPDTALTLYVIAMFCGSFAVTLFDSTTDGYAVDTTPRAEQGRVQGIMVGGRAVGFVLLSFGFGQLIGAFGSYRVVFIVMALVMLLPLVWVLRVEEPAARDESQQFDWAAFRELGRPRFMVFAVYAVIYSAVSFGIDGLPALFMDQVFGASPQMLGSFGVMRGLGAIAGALAGGLLLDRGGRRLSTFAAIGLIGIVGALFAAAPGAGAVVAWGVVWGGAWGFQETVFIAPAMDLADRRIAASMFALMMAISNLGAAFGEAVGTGLTDNIPFNLVFVVLAAGALLTVPVVIAMFRAAPELAQPALVEEDTLTAAAK